MIEALRHDVPLSMGIGHPGYDMPPEPVTGVVKDSLISDLASGTTTQ